MPTVLILLFSLLPALPASQAASPASSPAGVVVAAPPRYIKVDAPFAQKLVLDAKAAHPELKKIGMHAIPPGYSESAIIANPIVSKIGKLSSANDLTVVTSGQPKVYPHEEEGGFFDLGLPLADNQQRPIGIMVMEIPYKAAATKEDALRMGLALRDQISAEIPSKEALFAPVPR